MPAPEALSEDLALLESAVREAGIIALKYFGGDYKRWSKAGGSPVTEADLAVDGFLKKTLLEARPDYGWLSEESTDNPARLTSTRLFIVDPIDGTVAFLKGRPHFTICAAIVANGRPVAGVVYNPAAAEFFSACADGGAHLNGARIQAGSCSEIAGCRMLGQKALFQDPDSGWPPLTVENFSSIAYRVALVAAGRYDAMISLTAKRDWDMAAADIILTEAGGLLTDAQGKAPVYNCPQPIQGASIAAGPALHAALLAHLSRVRKERT